MTLTRAASQSEEGGGGAVGGYVICMYAFMWGKYTYQELRFSKLYKIFAKKVRTKISNKLAFNQTKNNENSTFSMVVPLPSYCITAYLRLFYYLFSFPSVHAYTFPRRE